jgi:tetratricopeptide (TPR) repeat protein
VGESDAGDDPVATSVDAGDSATGATRREGAGVRARPDTEHDDLFARGALIGRYVMIDVVGAGGMGVVYSAFDPELDRKVAIKVLQARPGGSESGGQTWLLREAQAMARLAHPNVVAVYDVGAIRGDLVFVAMELVEGVTLRAWLKERVRSWREVLPVMRAAGAGLAAAHAAGLVHRDFKPDNVLVGADGRVRVMDFGLARLDGSDDLAAARTSDVSIEKRSPLSERLTATGAMLGTPAYMAPEIYAGSAADAQADQFAFGVALYEALYRVRPYDRKALVEQRAAAPKPPAGAHAPAWLERIVLRTIALDPQQRFPTMDAVLRALAVDPAAKRRRIAIGAALAVACGGVAVGAIALHARGSGPAPCTDASHRLAGVWDAGARGVVEAKFHALAIAGDALAGTEKTLDTYAQHWVDMRTEACRATRVHGSQSEAVLTLRMACLDDRLVELQTLVGLFGTADAKLALGAVGAAQKLSSLAPCADVPALLAPDPLPKDLGARVTATALHAKLAEARAIYKTSRLTDTLALLAKIAPDVARLHHLPTEAELHLLTGQTQWVLQGAAQGEPELLRAVWAAEAGKADLVKLEAWLQLTNLANEGSRFEVAAERLQDASAALARVGTNWEFKVRILAAQALLASRQNHYDEACKIASEARTVAEQHTDPPSFAYALLVEASILTSAGRAQDAIAPFKRVLAIQDALGHHRIDVAVTLQNLAGAELATGHVDDAIAHLNDALAISEAIYGPDNAELAHGLSALAAAQGAKGDLAGGLATNQRALEIAEHAGTDGELYAFMLGQVADSLVGLDRPKEALPYLDRALAIQTAKLGASNVQVLTLMLTKCDVLHATGAIPAAVELCKRTLALGEHALGRTSPLLFLFYAHTGEVLADAKQPRDAVAMFERALALGASDPSDLHAVELLDAHALWDLHDHQRAIALARKARDGFASLGDAKRDQVAEADAWLKQHAKP